MVAEITITPIVSGELRPFIDVAIEEVKRSGIKYEVEALGTTVEGDIEQIFDVAKRAHTAVRQHGAERVITEVRIDDKASGVTMEEETKEYRSSV